MPASSTEIHGEGWNIDTSRWPLILITSGAFTPIPELERSLALYDQLLRERMEPYAVVFDNRAVESFDARQRKVISDYNERNLARTRMLCRGSAFVLSSSLIRGVMTAILWVRSPETQTRVFGDLQEALDWAEKQLREAGIPVEGEGTGMAG